MAYRERWRAEIAALQKILSGFDLRGECKWGKPCYAMDGKNVVIIQGFKEYCALGFFQGTLLLHPSIGHADRGVRLHRISPALIRLLRVAPRQTHPVLVSSYGPPQLPYSHSMVSETS